MTKGFMRRLKYDASTQLEKPYMDSAMIGANEVQQHDATYALDVNPANLTHHGLRTNHFYAEHFAVAAATWNHHNAIRPNINFRSFKRINNTVTGLINPSTAILDLANGTGTNAAGDCAIITWVHQGDLNDNLYEAILWMRRTAGGAAIGNSMIRIALADVTAVAANAATGALAVGAGAHNMVPEVLDPHNYFTAALAYGEIRADAVPIGGNGAPMHFEVYYNAAAVNDGGLVPGHVYALIVYLFRDGAGVANDTFEIFGSQLAAQDPTSETYFGAAGWNGVIAQDATCLSAYFVLSKATAAVINQIHFHSETGQTLGGAEVMNLSVSEDADAVENNIPANGEMWRRSIVRHVALADERTHAIILEGKAVVPRRHYINFDLLSAYTGIIVVEINFWADSTGTNTVPNELHA